MTTSFVRISTLAAAIALAATSVAAADRTFNISPQPLSDAILELSKQANVVIVAPFNLVDGKQAPALQGEMPTEDALKQLLRGTDLTVSPGRNGALTVKKIAQRVETPAANPTQTAQVGSDVSRPSEAKTSIEEIVVTANKRTERLLDAATSVTALSGDSLVAKSVFKMEEFLGAVPGTTYGNFTMGGGRSVVVMRGIYTAGGAETVATFIDDIQYNVGSQLADFDPSDLERIEVLRGPQGTLYGAGAMGGILKYVTKSPDPTRFSGRIQVDGNTIDGGDEGYSVRGAVNIPLSDTAAVRASGFRREDGGFLDNLLTGEQDFNRTVYEGGRVAVGIRPSDDWQVKLSGFYQHTRAHANPNIDASVATGQLLYPDLKTRRAPGSDNSAARDMFVNLNIQGDLGWAQLTSLSAYSKAKFRSNFDYTGVLGPLVQSLFGATGVGVAILSEREQIRLTQELRLSELDGVALDWQMGAYHTALDAPHIGQTLRTFSVATGGPVAVPLLQSTNGSSHFEDSALFGSLGYNFSSNFDVTVGLRYSSNTQRGNSTDTGALVGATPRVTASTTGDTSTTWLVNPRYKFNEDFMVYGRVATGYRAGGANAAGATIPPTYGPDYVTNYELGAKGAVADGALTFDVAAFYINWRKVQLRFRNPIGLTYSDNIGKAHSQGVEGSLFASPVEGLTLAANLTYNEVETDRNLALPLVGAKGDWMPYSARWAGQASADYSFGLADSLDASVGATYRYTGKRFGAFETQRTVLPSYEVVDLRAGIEYGRVDVNAFVKNVGNSRGRLGDFRFGTVTAISIITPRTFGVSVATEF